jgi:hypothetical protein
MGSRQVRAMGISGCPLCSFSCLLYVLMSALCWQGCRRCCQQGDADVLRQSRRSLILAAVIAIVLAFAGWVAHVCLGWKGDVERDIGKDLPGDMRISRCESYDRRYWTSSPFALYEVYFTVEVEAAGERHRYSGMWTLWPFREIRWSQRWASQESESRLPGNAPTDAPPPPPPK